MSNPIHVFMNCANFCTYNYRIYPIPEGGIQDLQSIRKHRLSITENIVLTELNSYKVDELQLNETIKCGLK